MISSTRVEPRENCSRPFLGGESFYLNKNGGTFNMQFINVTLKDNSKMTIPCNTKIVDFIKEFMVSLNKKL